MGTADCLNLAMRSEKGFPHSNADLKEKKPTALILPKKTNFRLNDKKPLKSGNKLKRR